MAHEDCCGCMACGDVCPKSCITFQKNDDGFLYPVVDQSTCIFCGKCVKICPELNPLFNNRTDEVYAAYANSQTERQSGSSGGLFGVIARYIIDNNGKVWGAAFDDNLQLNHVCAANHDDLKLLMKSKYLQSNTRGCFKQIADDLKNGILTLFCGTPCQCNALRNYIGNSDSLYLIDLICHGVPSQDLFDKSIKYLENSDHCHVTEFTFRSKYKGVLHPHAFSYKCTKNGKSKIVNGLHYQFPFYFGFQKHITLRLSCYKCKWARFERCGDITLGDFWGLDRIDHKLDPKTGISEVIVNTVKGQRLFDEISESGLIWYKKFKFRQIENNNECLQSPTKLTSERKELFEALQTQPFGVVVKNHLQSKRRYIFDLYYGMPGLLRKIIRKVMDKRMRYE